MSEDRRAGIVYSGSSGELMTAWEPREPQLPRAPLCHPRRELKTPDARRALGREPCSTHPATGDRAWTDAPPSKSES